MVARELQEGKSPDSIRAELKRRMNEAPPLLDEAVSIPIDGDPVRGPANAKITLVEFSDFQCPYCAVAVASLNTILAKHPSDVRLVFKEFPLDIHSQAAYAAEAALTANAQENFAPARQMYANFRSLSPERLRNGPRNSVWIWSRFYIDIKSGRYKPAVEKVLNQGEQAGVLGRRQYSSTATLQRGLEAADSKR